MKIILSDGSILTCSSIQIIGYDLYCDEYRIVPTCDVERIEEE